MIFGRMHIYALDSSSWMVLVINSFLKEFYAILNPVHYHKGPSGLYDNSGISESDVGNSGRPYHCYMHRILSLCWYFCLQFFPLRILGHSKWKFLNDCSGGVFI